MRLVDLVAWIEQRFEHGQTAVAVRVLDPDFAVGAYPGQRVPWRDGWALHRPLRTWTDLAERMRLRLRTPVKVDDDLVELTFERLDENNRPWSRHDPAPQRYGIDSAFQRICRLDDPYFVLDLRDAMQRVGLRAGARILDLGVNADNEIELLERVGAPPDAHWVGVDHSPSALAAARERFASPRMSFVEADLGALPDLGRFDLIVCLGTLQSPGVDDRELLRRLFQTYLEPDGSVILSVPNGQFVDGQPLYGARTVNITQPELSLLFKTVSFYKKYLQQHRKRVFITGKDDIFITGVG